MSIVLLVVSGLPHRLMEDDVFDGMFIPKGTLVSFLIIETSRTIPTYDLSQVFGNVW